MTAIIMDGKQTALDIRKFLAGEIAAAHATPKLAVILVGDNPASQVYVRNKRKAAEEIGMTCQVVSLPENVSEEVLKNIIDELNQDAEVNGIIVQLPLPKPLNALKVLSMIVPKKDVDGFSAINAGLLQMNSADAVVSATPQGVLALLQKYVSDLSGKHAVIIGRSNIVGRPLADLLLNQDCTVTVTHSKTIGLAEICKKADIVVAACGCPKMVKADWVKKGAVVIDVGINRVDGHLVGDVDFEKVKEVAGYLSPVPGGIGPMTVAMLLKNTWCAYQKQNSLND